MISRQITDAYQHDATPAGNETASASWAARLSGWLSALFKLPPSASGRIVILFVALALVKLALLVDSGKHLREIHWRVGGSLPGWSVYPVFLGFVGLGVWSLVEMGRRCQAVGLPAVRAANGMVLGLGLLFIFLTFHEGDKNYLYPVMKGILKWKHLWAYLSLNLFFRPPYLAAWLFGYALLYYIFIRTNRERWALRLTAVFAGVYGLLCLRNLASYRDELAVAGCFGVAALWYLRRSDKRLNAAWLLVPLGWTLLAWGIFYAETSELRNLNPYFRLITGAGAVLFVGATLLARARGFGGIWIKAAPFCFVAFFLLTSTKYPMAANYNNLLCYGLQLPHYFLGEMVVAGLLAICAALYCRLRPRGSLWWLDVLGLVLVATAVIDFRLSQVMGVRLGWDLLSFGHSPAMMWRMALPYLPGLALLFAVMVVSYAFLLRAAKAWLSRGRAPAVETRPGNGGWYVAACFALLGVAGLFLVKPDNAEGQAALRLAQTSPWWKRAAEATLSREEFLRSATALELGNFQTPSPVQPLRPRRNLNVLLVFMESTYNQHLSLFSGTEDTQPLLSKYKDRMEVFPNFFANFASSIHARFATFTSLHPIKDYNAFTLKRVGVKSIFEVLHDNEYECSMFYSSYFDYTGFRDFLKQRGIGAMFDADTMPGERKTKRVSWGLREEETMGAIRQQIKKYAADDERFFLTYVPAAPHYPYDSMPAEFRRHKPEEFKNYTPHYLNELLYMDWVVSSIVDQLKESNLLDKTLVIITSDHGEMLGGKGNSLGHGWRVTPELSNVPLMIMDPDQPGYRINETIGSQIDVLPTILDLLGIPAPSAELYQGQSLYGVEEEKGRLVYLNSYQEYGVIAGRHLMLGDRTADRGDTKDSGRTAYLITNDGSKTIFTEDTTMTNRAVSIQQFDEFQTSLLRNYSLYCESIGKGRAGNSHSARPWR